MEQPEYLWCPARAAMERCKELRARMEGPLPEPFFQHLMNARREVLLAARSLIDAALEKPPPVPKDRPKKIEVE